jgi:myosin heavy subunit
MCVCVDEEGFSRLKNELNLNFEFHSIEKKIVDLIRQCIAADKQHEELQHYESFIVKLILNNSEGELRFVKNDSFREIPIFSLNIRAGNDPAVKEFLSNEVIRLKIENKQLSQSKNTNEDTLTRKLSNITQEYEVLRERNIEMKSHYEKEINSLRIEHQNVITNLKEKHIREQQETNTEYIRQRKQLEESFQQQNRELRDRNNELTEQNRILSDTKCEIEGNYRMLNQTQIKDMDQHQYKITALNQKVKDKEELIDSVQKALEDSKNMCRDLEKKIASHDYEIKNKDTSYLEREKQLKKANEIILKFDSDLKLKRQKNSDLRRRLQEAEKVANKLHQKLKNNKEEYVHSIQKLSQQLESKHLTLDGMQDKLKIYEDEKERLTAEKNRLNQVINELFERKDALTSSNVNATKTPVFSSGTTSTTSSAISSNIPQSRPGMFGQYSSLATQPPIAATFARKTNIEPNISTRSKAVLSTDVEKLTYTPYSVTPPDVSISNNKPPSPTKISLTSDYKSNSNTSPTGSKQVIFNQTAGMHTKFS